MKASCTGTTSLLLGFLLCAAPAAAQYMYLDSNANGIHDVGDMMNPNGMATTVDVYLITNQGRDGLTVACDQDPSDSLSMNFYIVTLEASDGSVTYSDFINRFSATHFGVVNTDHVHYQNGYGGIRSAPPGKHWLCTLTITGRSGTPRVDIVDDFSGSGLGNTTCFGSQCDGLDFDNAYALGRDWFDTDGLVSAPNTDRPPLITAPSIVGGEVGSLVSFTVTVADPDGDPLVSLTAAPLPEGATFTASADNAAGTFAWTPGLGQAGVYEVTFTALNLLPASAVSTITIGPGIPTAISVALEDAQAEVGIVRLRWVVPDARTTVCIVERRDAASDWASLGQADEESASSVRYEDRSVVPGERYGYRLQVQTVGDQGYSDEVWVSVPTDARAPMALRLDPVYPNPFEARMNLSFAVPRSGSVRLAIYTVVGRKVVTIFDRSLPSGWRSVAWDGRDASGRSVASGTYFAKLESAGQVQVRKVILAR